MLFFVFRSRSNYSCPPRGSAVLQKENFDNKSLYYIKSEIFIGIIKSFFYKYMFRIPRNWQNPKPPCKIWKIGEFFKHFKSVNLSTDRPVEFTWNCRILLVITKNFSFRWSAFPCVFWCNVIMWMKKIFLANFEKAIYIMISLDDNLH